MAETARVTFEPSGVTVDVPVDTTVLEASRRARMPLPSTCGGRGTCGDCAVRVIAGEVAPPGETEAASLRGAPAGVRLACAVRVSSPLTVRPVAPVRPTGTPQPAAPSGSGAGAVAAVDLGTTTITAAVLDAASGSELGTGSAGNPQRTFGADVASRLTSALAGDAEELRELAVRGIGDALAAAGVALGGVGRAVLAGNTVMAHLLLGAEASGLGAHPYRGSLTGTERTTAGELGLAGLPAAAIVVVLPPIAAFVGGDVTAGILATRLDETPHTRVLIDLGTNAEVVVAANGRLTVASAPAGPAFEAAGLACGGPAVEGAVAAVTLRGGSLVADVIGGGEPRTLCGSGALSLVAALLDVGHVDVTGRMHAEGPLSSRFHTRAEVTAFQLAGEPGGPLDVYLTQLDVRELQLAKAAVATALRLTLEVAGAEWGDVAEILVAGAFGGGVNGGLLGRLGVLPADFGGLVTACGDTALAGAALVAHDPAEEAHAERVASSASAVELARLPAFARTFLANTDFPR